MKTHTFTIWNVLKKNSMGIRQFYLLPSIEIFYYPNDFEFEDYIESLEVYFKFLCIRIRVGFYWNLHTELKQ